MVGVGNLERVGNLLQKPDPDADNVLKQTDIGRRMDVRLADSEIRSDFWAILDVLVAGPLDQHVAEGLPGGGTDLGDVFVKR